jgi:hypothetical protein
MGGAVVRERANKSNGAKEMLVARIQRVERLQASLKITSPVQSHCTTPKSWRKGMAVQ